MKKSIKKIIKIVIVVTIIILGIIVLKVNLTPKPLEVEVVDIVPKQVIDSFTEEGIVKRGNDFNIISDVSGEILEVYALKNTYIEQNQPIVKIDSKDYEYQKLIHQNNINSHKAKSNEVVSQEKNEKQDFSTNIDKLNSELKSLESQKISNQIKKEQSSAQINKTTTSTPEETIEVLELAVNIAQNNYDYNKKNYDNINILYEIGASSKEQLDNAKNDLTKTENDLFKAKTELDINKNKLEKLKGEGKTDTELNELFYQSQSEDLDASIASLKSQIKSFQNKISTNNSFNTVDYYNSLIENENLAISQLDDKINQCSIMSKVSGYITNLPVKNQSLVKQGDLLGTVNIESNFTIDVNVLTSLAPYLKINQPVNIVQKLKSNNVKYNGKIKEVYNYANTSISALGLDERRVNVVIEITDKDINLKDGYEVDVEFETYKKDNQLAVPNSSIFKINEEDYVYKIENEKVVLTKVSIDYKANEETVIVNGINQGDKIVYNANTERIQEGINVLTKNK